MFANFKSALCPSDCLDSHHQNIPNELENTNCGNPQSPSRRPDQPPSSRIGLEGNTLGLISTTERGSTSHEVELVDHVDGHTLSTIPLSVGCPDPSMLSNIFQESLPENLIDLSYSSLTPHHAFLTSSSVSSVYSAVTTAFTSSTSTAAFSPFPVVNSGDSYVPLPAPDINIGLRVDDTRSEIEIPLFTVPSGEDLRLDVLAKTWTAEVYKYLQEDLWTDAVIRCKSIQGKRESNDLSFVSFNCHKMMLGAAFPLLASCMQGTDHQEGPLCLIFPDFNSSDIEDFLSQLYLHKKEGKGSLLRYLLKGSPLYEDTSKNVKFEKMAEKINMDIKLEESDTELGKKSKMKKKMEESDDKMLYETNSVNVVLTEENLHISSNINDPLPCQTCGKLFKSRKILKQHEHLHEEPRFRCNTDNCSKSFYTSANLKAHIDVVHLKKKEYPCEKCGKLFYNSSKLKEHSVTHTDDKFICQHCPSIFASAKSLKSHVRFQHTSEDNIPKCSVCGKRFSSRANLKSHTARVHQEEKNFTCDVCGKKFFTTGQLEVHMSLHTSGEKKFTCDICKVMLKSKKSFHSHLKLKHSGLEKKFVCHRCGKAFQDLHHLRRHMHRHGQKIVSCETCAKVFDSLTSLQQHVNNAHYTGKRWDQSCGDDPPNCRICCLNFPDNAAFRNHVQIYHKDIPS